MKDSFVFYKSFYDAIKKIPEEYQLELYNAILSYSLEGIEPNNLSSIAEAMFILIKPNIDSSQKRYEASVENGKKGGRPLKKTQEEPDKNLDKTQQKPNQNLDETQEEPDENLNVDVDDNVDVNDNNINNNEQKQVLLEHFEIIWGQYPHKKGKTKALGYYFQWIKGRKISGFTRKLTDEQMYRAVMRYKKECEEKKIDTQFIKHGDTFFNKAILDYLEEQNE